MYYLLSRDLAALTLGWGLQFGQSSIKSEANKQLLSIIAFPHIIDNGKTTLFPWTILSKREFHVPPGTTGEAASSVCWPKSTLHFLRPFGFSLGLKLAELRDLSYLKRCFFRSSVYSSFSHWVTFLFSTSNRISIFESKMAIGQSHRIVILCFSSVPCV